MPEEKSIYRSMKIEKLAELLEEALQKIGYTVRTEKGDFRGGSCVFRSEQMVFVNRRMALEERAQVMAKVLASEEIDQLFLLPEVRSYVEKFSNVSQAQPVENEAVSNRAD